MKNKRAADETMAALHRAVAQQLLDTINAGTASPAEINAAIKFLQNNGIQTEVTPDSPLDKLNKAIPTFSQMVEDDED